MLKKSKVVVSSLMVTLMFSFVFTMVVSANEQVETGFEVKDYVTYSEKQEKEIETNLKEKEEEGYVTYNLDPVNESTMELTVNNADITLNTNNSVEVHSPKTGAQTTLPTTAVDQDGNDVKIQYELLDDNTIEVQVIKHTAEGMIQTASWQGALECGLGIAGTGGTAGLAGFGGLGIPGAIVGGVAGGMAGAQSACFD
ncbi:hypothetical protein U0355_01290 [Salimicrobium sp. PL1-032A]|uniref:hypothetical protein n=1 Tax=Salimicrobium sp. PL1-032A TaxID=3095364 RepID=UPI003261CB6B